MRSRRDPESERRKILYEVRSLYYGLIRLDPSNTGHVGFRTGTNVYISSERIENAFVLADLLETIGYEALARDLAKFARGVQLDDVRPRVRRRNVTTPTYEGWRRLNDRILAAIREVEEGVDVREVRRRPYVRLVAQRIPLDRGGYERSGRYWGVGQPLYRVLTRDETGDYADVIDSIVVRARNAEDAKRQIAERFGIRYKRSE